MNQFNQFLHRSPEPVSGPVPQEFIPLLVELLESDDTDVQTAAVKAHDDENQMQIVECETLPELVLMLHSDNTEIQNEAVKTISTLVDSFPNMKEQVVEAGALQPVIELLSSSCSDSLKTSAVRLLGNLAARDTECQIDIVQRGALRPLINMLESQDPGSKEASAFSLAKLVENNTHNQDGIVHSGGVKPLLKLLDSKYESAAIVLYELSDYEDHAVHLIKDGAVQKLLDTVLDSRYVADTLDRLEGHVVRSARVVNRLLYFMREGQKPIQRQRVALALAHLCYQDDIRRIFVDNKGLDLLLEPHEPANIPAALYKLANKAGIPHLYILSPIDAPLPSPSPSPAVSDQCVYFGEQCVNNPTVSDVTFLVEGKQFFARRACLVASSDAFRAMVGGGYRERDAKLITIPNFTWRVFELMMRYIYTGSVNVVTGVDLNVMQDLLRAADQYLLEGLKRLCENVIAAQHLSVENVSEIFEVSQTFNAASLRRDCILFFIENYRNLSSRSGYLHLMERIFLSETRQYFRDAFYQKLA